MGRNRREACKLAGVTPVAKSLNPDDDPTAYVLSANIHRRHMTKGQRAMAVAKIYPEPKKGGRGKKAVEITGFGVDQSPLSHARTVLKHAPDLADNVLSGATGLDAAYQTARERKDAAASDEARLADLRARYPELADKVVEACEALAPRRLEC